MTDGPEPVDFESLLLNKAANASFWKYLSVYETISGYHTPRPELETADAGQKFKVTHLPIDQASMPHSVPAFIGTKKRSEKVPPFEELLREGYSLIEYDGYVKTSSLSLCSQVSLGHSNIHLCADVQDH